MGLLSRLGNQFSADMPLRGMAEDAGRGAAYGTVGGAALGGMSGGPDEGGFSPGVGMLGGAAGGAAAGGAMGARHIVMAIARALKQQHPDAPDELILQEAMKLAKQQGGGMPPGGAPPPRDPGMDQSLWRTPGGGGGY